MQRRYLQGLIALLLIQLPTGLSYAQQQQQWQRVLIETHKPYDSVVRAVEAGGGRVTQQFTYVDAIAAEVLEGSVQALGKVPGVQAVVKDAEVQRPAGVSPIRARTSGQLTVAPITTESSAPLGRLLSRDLKTLALEHPEIYAINFAGTNIERLHGLGFTGAGVIVAVIDSGMRNGYKLVDDAVVGGFDLVDDGAPGPAGDSQSDWKKENNDGHGTFAAGLIAGKASFVVGGVMQDALEQYAPGAIVDGKLPLVGTSPDAGIYAVRVFGQNATAGATASTILAAIDHVIAQRDLYDTTQGKRGVKIEVANLSLGISTLAAGQSLLDQAIDKMLGEGIVPIISEGNVGPSALTTSSPGSSRSAVTVGGSSHAASERIMNEVLYATQIPDEYYEGIGGDIRPFSPTQIAWFSSRGPNADGRMDPDIVASAVGNIGQGYCPDQMLDACTKRLSIASGTSFSAPIVSGIAATLRQAFPLATATQIRNALIATGQTSQIAPYFDAIDRGDGLVDAYAAYSLLATGTVPDALPPFNTPWDLSVKSNIEQNPGVFVQSGSITEIMSDLLPGARAEILYEVPPDTGKVIVRITDIQTSDVQNAVQGDGLFLYVHSARTSSIGALGDYKVDGEFFEEGDEGVFEIENPEVGIMRITVNPDNLNAGTVAATVTVDTIPQPPPGTIIQSQSIGHAEIKQFPLTVPPGTTRLDFLLTWVHDWSVYPTTDIDLIVCSPSIAPTDCRSLGNKRAATLAAPERVSIENPAGGTWTLLVHGFNVPTITKSDNFQLRVNIVP
ncbi:MAG TPA: S8 family serine peptidase [Terriglobia bacterium]|nr:S8 family serine peptidase [Terriglobia bacterium]